MIVLDTHTWIWWVHGHSRLSESHAKLIQDNEEAGLGVCAMSCWEVPNSSRSGDSICQCQSKSGCRSHLDIQASSFFLSNLVSRLNRRNCHPGSMMTRRTKSSLPPRVFSAARY